MSKEMRSRLADCFNTLPDPRVAGRCDHKLIDIIIIAICGVLCGAANSCVGIETAGRAKESRFRQFLELEHEDFQSRFIIRWAQSVFRVAKEQVIASDGKTSRGSHDKSIGQDAIHLVNAWARTNGIAPGQHKVDNRSNEITAIPELLCLPDVSDCIVTIPHYRCEYALVSHIPSPANLKYQRLWLTECYCSHTT